MPTQQTVTPDSNGYHNTVQDPLQDQLQNPVENQLENQNDAVPNDRPADLAGDFIAVIPETPAVARRRFPGLTVLILGTVLVMGGAGVWHWWRYASTHETTDDAQLQGHIYAISSRIPGTIEDRKSTRLNSSHRT